MIAAPSRPTHMGVSLFGQTKTERAKEQKKRSKNRPKVEVQEDSGPTE